MFGLVSPQDILDAVTSANNAEKRESEIAKLKKTGEASNFEDILLSTNLDLLRPDRAILNAMDSIRDEDEERLTGIKKSSAFDDIISAKVAEALGPYYSGSGAPRLDITSSDPFTPAKAISKFKPRIDPAALKIAKENGFPVDTFFGDPLLNLLG